MKRLLAVLLLALAPALALAAEKNAGGNWYVGLGGGISLPSQNWHSSYDLGYGGELIGGYNFDRNFAIQMQVDNMFYSATILGISTSVYNLRPVLEAKASAEMSGIKPYLFAGPALNISFASTSGTTNSNTDFAAKAGVGVQFDLGSQTNLFVEGKYHMTFLSNSSVSTIEDVPVEMGVLFDL